MIIRRVARGAAGATLLLLSAASATSGQQSGRGFLFAAPRGTFALRGGFAHANAGSDVFSFVTRQLTIDRADFSGAALAGELAIQLAPRWDLNASVTYVGANRESEFRDFVDQDGMPITQTTTFQRVPVTLGLKGYLLPRGRSLGRFAWVPARAAPFVAVGAGAMWFRFRQRGDFIDFNTNDVFSDDFNSSRWVPAAHAGGGVDVSIGPRFAVTTDARYMWANGKLGSDFVDFKQVDLSGYQVTAGMQVRF